MIHLARMPGSICRLCGDEVIVVACTSRCCQAYVTTGNPCTIRSRVEGSALDTRYRRTFFIETDACPWRQHSGEYAIYCLYSSILTVMKSMCCSIGSEYFEILGYLFVFWSKVQVCRLRSDPISAVPVSKYKDLDKSKKQIVFLVTWNGTGVGSNKTDTELNNIIFT